MKKSTTIGALLLIAVAVAWMFIDKEITGFVRVMLLGVIIGSGMAMMYPVLKRKS